MKMLLPILFFLSSCSDVLVQEPDTSPKGGDVDYCEKFGWYNDGRCDKDCDKPDPDCKDGPVVCDTEFVRRDAACDVSNIRCEPGTQYYEDACGECGCVGSTTCVLNPDVTYFPASYGECNINVDEVMGDFFCDDPDKIFYQDECGCGCIAESPTCDPNPDVDYVAFGDDCQLADFLCDDDSQYYDDECGCGCLKTTNQCMYDEPDVIWFNADPETCSLEDVRPECPEGMAYFDNECGCGCKVSSSCESDADCPDGYCPVQLNVCVNAECGDGSEVFCNAIPPECPSDQVPSVENGCWGPCVSARTCEFVCETDADCREAGLGPVCISPACPDVIGAVCEKYCGR